jgi:hypothetical protein
LVGTGSREKFALAPLPKEVLDSLRKARLLVATASKRSLEFDLAAAGDVVASIETCVERMKNFAIKTGALRDFLDNSAVPYETANGGEEMKTADIASSARTYTMLISCTARITHSERK